MTKMIDKIKRINPVCRIVGEHRELCRQVLDKVKAPPKPAEAKR